MHELAVCQAFMAQVESIARRESAVRVTAIHLAIGPLSGVEPDLLERAWPLVSASTVAEDAELVMSATEIRVSCSACGAETAARPNRLVCGDCGDWRTRLVSGDEMLLARLELERRAFPGETPTRAGTEEVGHV